MNSFDILFLLLLSSTGFNGQQIDLEVPSKSMSCEKGYRGDIDHYFINVTVGPNVTYFENSGWSNAIKIQVLPVGAKQFTPICNAIFGSSPGACNPQSSDVCYCYKFDASLGLAHIVVTSFSRASQSLGIVRGEWEDGNGNKFHSAENKTLPEIYDVDDANLTLFVNGVPANEESDSCGSSFIADQENIIKLCCSKAAMPCYPRIAFNGTIVTKNLSSPCVNYTFAAKNETVNVTKSYSVCSTSDIRQSGSCVIETSLDNTTAETNTSSTESGTDNTTIRPTISSSSKTGTDNTTIRPTISSSSKTGTDNTTIRPTISSSSKTDHGKKVNHRVLIIVLCTVLPTLSGAIITVSIVLYVKYHEKKKFYCGSNNEYLLIIVHGVALPVAGIIIAIIVIQCVKHCNKKKSFPVSTEGKNGQDMTQFGVAGEQLNSVVNNHAHQAGDSRDQNEVNSNKEKKGGASNSSANTSIGSENKSTVPRMLKML